VGWIVIVHEESGWYFRETIRREKFFSNLLEYAMIAKWRIEHRWPCSSCGKLMSIINKPDGGMFWRCEHCKALGRKSTLPWDYKLPEKMRAYLERKRGERERHRLPRKAAGLPIHVRKNARRMRKRTR
jgi:hypothetical protein